MILHIPHSATYIPPQYKNNFCIDVTPTINFLTDHFTDELFYHPEAKIVKFSLSRIICDVERFENGDMMEKYGMGVVYTKNHLDQIIHDVTSFTRKEIIETYYKNHHEELKRNVDIELAQNSKTLIVDCHSFHDEQALHVKDTSRPDICIGTDEYHTPSYLVDIVYEHFHTLDYSVSVNSPFSGSLVPLKHYKNNPSVHSIMVEINRKLYLHDNFEKNNNFVTIQKQITKALEILYNEA